MMLLLLSIIINVVFHFVILHFSCNSGVCVSERVYTLNLNNRTTVACEFERIGVGVSMISVFCSSSNMQMIAEYMHRKLKPACL